MGEEIRWKRARPVLLRELETHLLEERDHCLSQGMTEEEAQAEAIRQMGDPVQVGQGLDAVHRPKPQWGLLLLAAGLAVVGWALCLWLTAGWAEPKISAAHMTVCLVLAIAALFGGYFLDYTFLGRWAVPLYGGALAVGILLLRFGRVANGISYATQFFAFLFPLAWGCWMYAWRRKGWHGFLLALLGGVPFGVICHLARDDSGLGVLGISGFALLFFLGSLDWFGLGKKRTVALTGALAVAVLLVGAVLFTQSSYLMNRITLALHPELDPQGQGFTGTMVREVLAGATLFGQGEVSYLPGGDGKLLLVNILRAFGWIPFWVLIVGMVTLVVLLLRKGTRQVGPLAKLTVLGVVLPLALQTFLSLSANLGFVFDWVTTPILVAHSGLIIQMALLGLLLSVFRQGNLPEGEKAPRHRPGTRSPEPVQ